jgi:diamine N-acetyltransferase
MKILVRRLEYSDLSTRVEWFNTPSVYQQMTLSVPMSLSDTQKWFTQNTLNPRRLDFSFLIQSSEHKEYDLGAMGGLVDIDNCHQRAELYILVKPGMTGQGIGQRSVRWLCNYGFLHLSLIRIYLYTIEGNDKARQLYTRNGFSHEGILRKHLFHNGNFEDRYIQGLLRSEWQALPWHLEDKLLLEA